jgi:hypothetical protein
VKPRSLFRGFKKQKKRQNLNFPPISNGMHGNEPVDVGLETFFNVDILVKTTLVIAHSVLLQHIRNQSKCPGLDQNSLGVQKYHEK